jgi:nucleotide-binding universal stress UspA family protein
MSNDVPDDHIPAVRVFQRVLVGVDGTMPGFEACRQAARLAVPGEPIEAVAVVHLGDAIQAGIRAAGMADLLAREAAAALVDAAEIIGPQARTTAVNGVVVPTLLRHIEQSHTTLVALGSHGHRRLTEIMIGGVAGELLHSAPCSVLIARVPRPGERFPDTIVVGVDGSADSARALEAARELAGRFDAHLRIVTAADDPSLDVEQALVMAPTTAVIAGEPVDVLAAEALAADLVVVGSRGLRGLQALGSVSERIAHQASCSVLVVRPAP